MFQRHVFVSLLAPRTRVATEAIYLMMRRAFESGCRRHEVAVRRPNAPSRAAAARFGFPADNFDGRGRQRLSLRDLTAPIRGRGGASAPGGSPGV